MPTEHNAQIIWRDPEDGRLRLAETNVAKALGRYMVETVCPDADEVLDVTAEDAAERVLCLAEPGRPRVGDRVSQEHWEPGQVGVVTELATRIVGVAKVGPGGVLGTSCIVSIDRLTVEGG